MKQVYKSVQGFPRKRWPSAKKGNRGDPEGNPQKPKPRAEKTINAHRPGKRHAPGPLEAAVPQSDTIQRRKNLA